MNQPIMIEVGAGELIDKITILQIKSERIEDEGKLKNVRHELEVLSAARDANLAPSDELTRLTGELKGVNEPYGKIEDDIRACENEKGLLPDLHRSGARGLYHQTTSGPP